MKQYNAIINSFDNGQKLEGVAKIKVFGVLKLINYMEQDETLSKDRYIFILTTFLKRTRKR